MIAAKYNDLNVKEQIVKIGTDNKTPEFLKKFPIGKLPAFEGADGFVLYESNAIAHYIASAKEGTTLLGNSKKEAALVQQFTSFADNEFSPIAAAWLYPVLGYFPANDAAIESAKKNAHRALDSLNKHLASKTFLVGERVTLADIVMCCTLLGFYKLVFDQSFVGNYKNVNRWFITCINQPHFKSVLGEVVLCKKMMVPGDIKPATPAPKETQKPAVNEEDAPVKETKPKSSFELLPKPKLVLDEWKRFYSNNETRPTACDWFWKNFDNEGYTLWRCEYKYNDELTQIFMSSNLIGGFFQRLDHVRKYVFGSMLVLGENNNNEIYGYFLIRGKEMPPEIIDTADYESYKFTAVDIKNKAVRDDVDAVWAWDEKIRGKACADGKVFK